MWPEAAGSQLQDCFQSADGSILLEYNSVTNITPHQCSPILSLTQKATHKEISGFLYQKPLKVTSEGNCCLFNVFYISMNILRKKKEDKYTNDVFYNFHKLQMLSLKSILQ